jgi:hypothetical protein
VNPRWNWFRDLFFVSLVGSCVGCGTSPTLTNVHWIHRRFWGFDKGEKNRKNDNIWAVLQLTWDLAKKHGYVAKEVRLLV